MTSAMPVGILAAVIFVAIVAAIAGAGLWAARREFRDPDPIVYAADLRDHFPLPERYNPPPAAVAGTSTVATCEVVAVAGYGKHTHVTAVGSTGQRGPEENTEALSWRAVADLLNAPAPKDPAQIARLLEKR